MVDVITEVAAMTEYYQLAERLRAGGFQEDTSGDAPICRWKAGCLLLDVMPTNPQLLGFGSVWYREAFVTATLQTLPSWKRIHMITGPYFLACKLAAFRSRGEGDYLMSHDKEDVVAVLDGRPEVVGDDWSGSNHAAAAPGRGLQGAFRKPSIS